MKEFNKNDYRDTNKKHKVIIDTDPGVDDIACLIYALFEENVDIKLITTVAGNTSLDKTTRNTLHFLDLFDLDVPVASGSSKPMFRESKNAEFIHQEEGLGGYLPPDEVSHKVVSEDAVELTYKTIMEGDGDIILVVLGPQTNVGHLFTKHPDVIAKIPKIVFMGGSPYGHPKYDDYISFNISSDPEAFQIVLDSKIPLLMVPSDVGRRKAHLTENFVGNLSSINDVGKLFVKMYSMYWEPGYPDKRIATNDTLALYALAYPKMFTTEKVNITVDVDKQPGKTLVEFVENSNIEMVTEVDREAFLQALICDLKKLNKIKIKGVK